MTKINLYLYIILFSFLSVGKIHSQILDTTTGWIKLTDGLNFPEGPASDGKGAIYFSNCYAGWIGKFS
ncbi:MAG: hypothetical protein WHT45_08030, partial [Ignavibacterium sp.]